MRIAENVIAKIGKFVFPVDFVVLDMKEDFRISIILGRPFLVTVHAIIDVFNKKISFEIGNEKLTFDIEKSMKFSPSCDEICNSFDMVDLTIHDHMQETLPKDQLDLFLFESTKDCQLSKYINLWEDDSEIVIDEEKLLNNLDSSTTPKLFSPLDPNDCKNPTLFAGSTTDMEKQILKLKELPSHLEYAFLDDNQELPIIISSLLSHQEKGLLLQVLSKHKSALAWKVADIKGISLSFCTPKILMEYNFKPIMQPQYRLNPKVQDVVKVKIVKLLDAGLIYAISDNPWISPIHVVPNKRRHDCNHKREK
nr:hypothetical protein [Tanacetum cinerariifolium]